MLNLLLLFLLHCPSFAAERMIAYGYTNCVACHVNPQGRNLLTEYGNSIDESQSFRAGEYKPSAFQQLGGSRMLHTVRAYIEHSETRKPGQNKQVLTTVVRYQNATSFNATNSFVFGFEYKDPNTNQTAVTPYYTSPQHDYNFLDHAMWMYKPVEGFQVSIGKDQLPTGINSGDESIFIHARNRLGGSERPLQMKSFWWTKEYQVTSYVYVPNEDEPQSQRERGYGLQLERDFYNQRTVFGLSANHGTNPTLTSDLGGIYARVGSGHWGLLTEYDMTWRTMKNAAENQFRQQAYMGQLFYTPLEWIVGSVTYEFLSVEAPYKEYQTAYAAKIGLRLSRNFTVSMAYRQSEKQSIDTEKFSIALFGKL